MQDLMAAPHADSHSFRGPAAAERTTTPSKNAGVSVRVARMCHAYPARSMGSRRLIVKPPPGRALRG